MGHMLVNKFLNWLFGLLACSPSDLDADFEDNQDYDSTVSQSETKLPTFNPELACMGLSDALAPPHSGSQITIITADYRELRQVNNDICHVTYFKINYKLVK